jgi:nucleotide-binding universal stress UspA family protein
MTTGLTDQSPPLSILVPLDGSEHANLAVEAAIRLQPRRIVLLHVHDGLDIIVPEMILEGDDEQIEADRASLEAVAAPLRITGHEVETIVRSGDAATVILDEARAVDMIVMTTRGRGAAGRMIFGSVADRVSRSAGTPAMMVRTGSSLATPVRIVVPLDGSPTARQALPMATRLADALGCPIALVRAVDLDDVRATIQLLRQAGQADGSYDDARVATEEVARLSLAAEQARLNARGYDTDIVLLDGTPSFALLNEIGETDIVVMSTHGRSGYRRWLLGSVSEKLVREANAPVVLVPTRTAAPEDSGTETRGEDLDMTDNAPGHGERSMLELLHQEQYTPEEIAYVFGMDVDVILQAAHRHDLPAVFIGNDVASIKRSDLLKWMEERRQGGPTNYFNY